MGWLRKLWRLTKLIIWQSCEIERVEIVKCVGKGDKVWQADKIKHAEEAEEAMSWENWETWGPWDSWKVE